MRLLLPTQAWRRTAGVAGLELVAEQQAHDLKVASGGHRSDLVYGVVTESARASSCYSRLFKLGDIAALQFWLYNLGCTTVAGRCCLVYMRVFWSASKDILGCSGHKPAPRAFQVALVYHAESGSAQREIPVQDSLAFSAHSHLSSFHRWDFDISINIRRSVF